MRIILRISNESAVIIQNDRLDLRGYLVVNRNNLGILLRVGVKVGIYKIRLSSIYSQLDGMKPFIRRP